MIDEERGFSPRPQQSRVSVALCSCDGEKYIGEQLKSIAAQTRPPDELVVRDDRSTDRTAALVEEFAGQAPFPVSLTVNRERLGVTANFNRAIGDCRGEIILLCDQDDRWAEQKIARLEAELSAAPGVAGAFSDARVVDENLNLLESSLWRREGFGRVERELFRRGEAFQVLLRRSVVTGATLAFRASAREYLLPIPADWIHDIWISFMLAALHRINFLPEALLSYRQHGENLIGVRPSGWRAQADRARQRSGDYLAEEAARWEEARERLGARRPTPRLTYVISEVDKKIDFLKTRASYPSSGWKRRMAAFREFKAGHYSRYANGFRTFLKDAAGVR